MMTLYRQEMFKLIHKKSTWISIIIMAIQVIAFAFLCRIQPKTFTVNDMFYDNYTSTGWLSFVMIPSSASIIAMEFQYSTVNTLLDREYSRGKILISKWLTILSYSLFMYILLSILTLLGKITFTSQALNLTDKFDSNQYVWEHWVINLGACFITMWLLLSLVLLLTSFFKNLTMAVTVGIIAYFSTSIGGALIATLIQKWDWLKWNPLTMMEFNSQITDAPFIRQLTHLTNFEMLIGNLIYIFIFLGIGFLLFRKKTV